jgi:predicted nucleic acid-binding Zn ribbon protein
MARNKDQATIFKCHACGNPLPDGRRDKKTCSQRCRKRLSRKVAKVRAQSKIVRQALGLLRDAARDEKFEKTAIAQLAVIRTAAQDAYDKALEAAGQYQ